MVGGLSPKGGGPNPEKVDPNPEKVGPEGVGWARNFAVFFLSPAGNLSHFDGRALPFRAAFRLENV